MLTTLYGSPVMFVEFLKDKIFAELSFTVNIGIPCNKLLAKMASEFRKPNMVHTLFLEEIERCEGCQCGSYFLLAGQLKKNYMHWELEQLERLSTVFL